MKTTIILEIDHSKPFAPKVQPTDIVAQRVYSYLYAQGYEVGITAKIEKKLPVLEQPLTAEELTALHYRVKETM